MRKLNPPRKLSEIATIVGATLEGDPHIEIQALNGIQQAQMGEITFVANPYYRKFLADTRASAVIISENEREACTTHALVANNPRLALSKLASLCLSEWTLGMGIHSSAVVGENTSIAEDVYIGPHCVIGDDVRLDSGVVLEAGVVIGDHSHIGSGTRLKANVTIYDQVSIGKDCLIHSGTVIGSDGFGYAQENGEWVKMPHLGGVCIGDQVEIGSNTSIDRGFLEDTIIEGGVIIDNLVQIAHNVHIGARTAIAGCVGIAGSTKIGQSCMIGGGSSIAGHIEIGDGVHITGTSAVNRSLPQAGVYSSGFPARENHVWRKNVARFQFLDEMAKRLKQIERKVEQVCSTTNTEED